MKSLWNVELYVRVFFNNINCNTLFSGYKAVQSFVYFLILTKFTIMEFFCVNLQDMDN